MRGAAAYLDSVFQHRLMHKMPVVALAAKGRDEGGMYVYYPVFIFPHHLGRYNPQIPGQNAKGYAVLP